MTAAHKINPNYNSRLEWVPVMEIEVDQRIQRPLDQGWVNRKTPVFDPDALGYPVLVEIPAKGRTRRFVVDGQHRVALVRSALGDNQLVECEVIRGVSLEQAAKIFGLRNTVRSVSTVDRFLVGVTAGDEECVAITNIVHGFGLKIARSIGDGNVCAVAALQKVYRGDKAQGTGKNVLALKRTIGTALNAWGRTADAMTGSLIEGLGLVVLRYGDVMDFDSLEKKLRQFKGGALGLIGSARGLRDSFGGSVANCVAHQIVIVYNRGRAKHQLRDWNRGKGDE